MLWVANIILLGTIGLAIFKICRNDLSLPILISALTLRLLAGVVAGLLFYKLYQGGDSASFYNASIRALAENSYWSILKGDFVPHGYANQPRVIFFIQILSGFLIISGGSYWIATLYFSLMSLAASVFFVVQFQRLFPDQKHNAIICFLFLPSVLIWSSGILKDTVSYSAFVIVVLLTLKFYRGARLHLVELLVGFVSLIALLKIKHYLLIISLLFLGIVIGVLFFKKRSGFLRWAVAVSVLTGFFTLTQFVHPYLTINRIPLTLYENNKSIIEKTSETNQLGIVVEEPSWLSVIKAVPESAFTGLFRPTIFDKTPLVGLGHRVENFILVSLIFLSILIMVKQKVKIDWWLITPALLCIGILATLLAMSTPNLGTLVRYKNAFVPFFFLIASALPIQFLTSKSK